MTDLMALVKKLLPPLSSPRWPADVLVQRDLVAHAVRPWSTMRPGRAFAGMQARLWPTPAAPEPCRHGERPGACLACAIGDKCRSNSDGPHDTGGPDIGHCKHCLKRVRRLRLNAAITYVEDS